MDVLTSETCWAVNNEIIKQVTSSWSLFIQLPSLHFLFNALTILMISVSLCFYSMPFPTAILQLYCSRSTLFATFHWTRCLYKLLCHHNSSNAMSEKPAIFPQTQVTSNFPNVLIAKLVQMMCQSVNMSGPTFICSIFNLMVISIFIKDILPHVHL